MYIEKIAIQNFRIFKNEVFEFGKTTLIVGRNGVGKTSIVEGIAMLSTGASFRAGKVEEMVMLGVELGRVKGKVVIGNGKGVIGNGKGVIGNEKKVMGNENEELQLEVMVNRGEVQGKRTQRRLYSVNDVRRRKKDFVGKFQTVVFRPEDLRLIEGSPGRRRNFMDTALSGVDKEYGVALHTYEQALKRRNKLLWAVREREQQRQVLSYWNMLVVKHGQVLQEKRQEFLNFLQTVKFPFVFHVVYEPSEISAERIAEYESREIAAGHTLIGPHKDDLVVRFRVNSNGKGVMGNGRGGEGAGFVDLAAYGSRGQQRLGVLWLKLGEMAFVRERKVEQPVLLLDDIMSELDEKSREMVLGLVGKQQIIMTTADDGLVEEVRERVEKVGADVSESDEEVRVVELG